MHQGNLDSFENCDENHRLDFDFKTLPWVDRPSFQFDLERKLSRGLVTTAQAQMLKDWHSHGVVTLPGLVPGRLADNLLDHYERLWSERPVCRVQVNGGPCYLSDLSCRPAAGQGARVLDLHNLSEAGKAIMFLPELISFVRILLEDTPVGMQSLFFEYGSEQALHQDFVYVTSKFLSHLIGVWVALEDVGPEQGPLLYVPASQHIQKYDLGGGKLYFDETNRQKSAEWYRHINNEIDRMRLNPKAFYAKKGDVLLWHSALIHGGAPILEKTSTRKSFVMHYSSRSSYPRDYRNKHIEPEVVRINGGATYRWLHEGHQEDYFKL